MSLPGTGGSDAHRLEEIGRSYTLFPERIATLEELVAAIKAGSCRCGRPGE
ncbi:MAG TPA: PHP-associated domain-containing protein [Bacillota bacterium]|nr:PHP-associated domain-containing protein [Bacillota bacterium]